MIHYRGEEEGGTSYQMQENRRETEGNRMEIEGNGIFTERDGNGIGKNRRMFLMDNMSFFPTVQTIYSTYL